MKQINILIPFCVGFLLFYMILLSSKKHKKNYTKNIRKQLTKNEEIVNFAKITILPSYIFSIIMYILSFFILSFLNNGLILTTKYDVFLSLIIIFIFLLSILSINIYLSSFELAITNKRIIAIRGIYIENISEINLKKIEGCNIDRDLLNIIFDCATVTIKGTGTSLVSMPYITNFVEFKKSITDAIEEFS